MCWGPSKWLAIAVLALVLPSPTSALDTSQCTLPLGMESGAIPDDDISASSSFDSGNVGPQFGRLRTESHGGAWCPKYQITTEPKEWLEIDLHGVHVITAVETQGRFGNGQGQEFAEAYLLEYWRPRLGKWVRFRNVKGEEVLQGNTNTYLEAKRDLDPPVWASRVRFVPYSYHRRTVCMRVEIYGCYWKDGIVSYSMPQGDKRGAGWEFFDATYDGHWDGQLQRGLGQLTDGKVGPENFKMGYYDYERGQGWVGWRNDTRAGQPVEIKFEFDQVREFTAVHIFCNNQFTREVQVFSEAKIMFSVGGKIYPGEPITYSYMEDRIFEHSRNITIKLHHRIGRFVTLQLHFAARWIMISEVNFESDIAHGNFTPEERSASEGPVLSDVFVDKTNRPPLADLPVSTAKQEDETYMAVLIGALMAVIILLAVAIFLIVSRHRQSKNFASPLAAKAPSGQHQHLSSDSSCGTAEKCGAPYCAQGVLGPDTALLMDAKLEDYQEPYQALKYAPYYSYSTVVMDTVTKQPPLVTHPETGHEYAVPEIGTTPLLTASPQSRGTSTSKSSKVQSPSQQEVLTALKRRLENTSVPEFPRHRLRMLSKLGEGAFGTVYVAEADGILEYGTTTSLSKRLVAVKFLLHNASEKEKQDFQRDVRILAALEDHNIARVLGVCSQDEPLCVVMEYLEHGDLCQFLRSHGPADAATTLPMGVKTLSYNCLLYMSAQIASGMRYLESLNFVHRDLSTRNCLVGKAYHIKISDFGTDNDIYAEDYYKVDGGMALPVRWMAWESIYLGKYTTKSDVWSFGVTLWEILHLARRRPYDSLADAEVVENLGQLFRDEGDFLYLPRPAIPPATKDIVDLMGECWRRNEVERPSFREIHLFLQRKTLGYAPV
ncbi:discoidin domain-containing receptor 2-like isoform X2 [Macrosteles quadrilineatus]|uniref:discoidin domain-containing receptor 2-like isoform X2 n=1 Tax=Macrosteles quadrilineatus TaxID=74068 RepID=UPI0023E2CCC5|nr:discoidin domain-containing receptor 2-like isoform X2 [Macrosteles quadrilineatus]